jgi:hypothetical protein
VTSSSTSWSAVTATSICCLRASRPWGRPSPTACASASPLGSVSVDSPPVARHADRR